LRTLGRIFAGLPICYYNLVIHRIWAILQSNWLSYSLYIYIYNALPTFSYQWNYQGFQLSVKLWLLSTVKKLWRTQPRTGPVNLKFRSSRVLVILGKVFQQNHWTMFGRENF
jgi:hypothetical protein